MLRKAWGLAVDEIVLDLEDAVAAAAKEAARDLVGRALSDRGRPAAAVAVRVNGLDSPWCHRDVVELVERAGPAIDSLVVPKVESAADVQWIDRLLGMLGEPAAGIGLQALVETAAGLRAVGEIATASPRLEGLILGYADLAASLGRALGEDDPPERWLHAQETLLTAARAAGLAAIDGPYLAIGDDAGLRRRAEHVRGLGFDGKWAVHPRQVAVIARAFTPSPEELERASAILAALERAEREADRGALEHEGAMIDEAVRKLAAGIVARGRAAELAAAHAPVETAP